MQKPESDADLTAEGRRSTSQNDATLEALAHANVATELDLLLLSSDQESVLYPELLEFLLHRAGLDAVWLGHRGSEGELVFDAIDGVGMEAYLADVTIGFDGDAHEQGPVVLAWNSGMPQIVPDWATDPRTVAWREAGARAGWRGGAVLPVQGADGRRDLLAMYSRKPDFFDQIHNQRLVWHLHAVLGLKLGRMRLMNQLREQGRSLQMLKAAIEASEFGVCVADAQAPDYPLVYVNPGFERISGYTAAQALGRNPRFLQGGENKQPALEELRAALREGRSCSVQLRNVRADGHVFWNEMSLAPVRDESGTITHVVGLVNDVSARHALEAENASTQGLYRALLAEEELVLSATDLPEMLQQACERLSASDLFSAALVGRAGPQGDIDLLAQAGRIRISETWYRPKVDGEQADQSLSARVWNSKRLQFSNDYLNEPAFSLYRDELREVGGRSVAIAPILRGGHRWALLGVVSDRVGVFTPQVVELLERVAVLIGHGLDAFDLRRRLQQEHRHISWLAEHDPLTGLLNRRGLRLRLEEALSQVDAQGGFVAVGILDFDDFKQINDNYGHAAGDGLLRTVAARLVEAVRSSDTVARLGGDEIALVLQGMAARDDLEPMLSRIRRAVDLPVALPGGERVVHVRASLGFTIYPDDTSEPDDLLRHADQALYAIKQQSRSASAPFWRVYQPATDRDHFNHLRLVRDRFAEGGLRVHYQPVVDLSSGRVTEMEALARLDDGNGKLIAPLDFIHQLGREGLVALTGQVLRQAVADAQQWQRDWGVELNVAVNMDPAMLASGEALALVNDVVATASFSAKRIVLEILEHSDFLSLTSAQQALSELRAVGCRIALDDIGSAYSSLLRMKELPIDIIKLDQGFIRGLAERPQDLRFVQSLTQLARGLGVDFVAEGAETEDIVEALRALRVQQAQGYGIARPMPAADFGPWLQNWSQRTRPDEPSLLTRIADMLVGLDGDLLLASRPSVRSPDLSISQTQEQCSICRWLRQSGLPHDSPLVLAHQELHAMFHDWLEAGRNADSGMIQSALDHFLRTAGDYLHSLRA